MLEKSVSCPRNAPCYFITNNHYPTYREMMEKTEWGRYRVEKDERCAQCMMHCGFEPSVVIEVGRSWKDIWEMMVWNMTWRSGCQTAIAV